jgi:FkbM family methyltransferase
MAAVFTISELAGSVAPQVQLPTVDAVDVGAMFVGEEGPYAPLLKQGIGRVVGFEPVQAECDRLNAMAKPGERYLPYFIGDGAQRTFYLTNHSMTSSLYEPNTALLKRFQNLEPLTQVVSTHQVQTRRLDDIPEIPGMDLLKADIQGAELDMLRGAERLLKSALVLHIEVEFLEMYKGQPLFGDVDSFLRARGFVLHTFLGLAGRVYQPLFLNNDPNQAWRQHIWSDVVYVRDFMRWKELDAPALLKLAAILYESYQSFDLAALALQHYQARTGTRIWDAYMTRLIGSVPNAPALE